MVPRGLTIKKEAARPQRHHKAEAQHQTRTQMPAVTHKEVVPVPPSCASLAVPMAPSEPLSPRSPAGNLRNQLRCFRIHSKSTCEPPAMPRTDSTSSLADAYEALGAVEFHRLDFDYQIAPPKQEAPLTPGRHGAWAGEQLVTFMGMPEPMSAMSMDLGEDATRKRTGSACSRRRGRQSNRHSSVRPLAPVRLPSQSHTRQTPACLTNCLGASSPLPQPPLRKTGSATRQPFIHESFRASSMGVFRRTARSKVNPGLQLPALQNSPVNRDQWLKDRIPPGRALWCM